MARKKKFFEKIFDPFGAFDIGREDPEFLTKTITDPAKTAVSSPLSSFLAGRVGQGLPRFPGQLSEPLSDILPESSYSEFLNLKPSEFFNTAIGDPETKRFKEELLPTIREGFAGSLRGSGRFREEEAGIGRFSEFLVGERARRLPELAKGQLDVASKIKAQRDADLRLEYEDWFKSLPENNPALAAALEFLRGPTGTDTAVALDPGREGILRELLASFAQGAGQGATTAATGGTS